MSNRIRTVYLVFGVLALALSIGCGSSTSSNPPALDQVDFGKATVAYCLKANGASFADSINDLAFFTEAEEEETASKFGFTADEAANLLIELYEDGEEPRTWLLWTGQPFGEQKSPQEIIETAPSEGYVAYVVRPSSSERRRLSDCTN